MLIRRAKEEWGKLKRTGKRARERERGKERRRRKGQRLISSLLRARKGRGGEEAR